MTIENDLLNLKQACDLTGASETTLRKYLGLGKNAGASRLPNARKVTRDNKEIWEIPLSDLHNAGLMKGKSLAAHPAVADQIQSLVSTAEQNQAESFYVLKVENEALKAQVAMLERNLEDLREEIRFSRRAIETAETQKARRKFWQRNP
jgi:hypothetical protein